MVDDCLVKGCKTNTLKGKQREKQFVRLPTKEEVKQKWINLLKINPNDIDESSKICPLHFYKYQLYKRFKFADIISVPQKSLPISIEEQNSLNSKASKASETTVILLNSSISEVVENVVTEDVSPVRRSSRKLKTQTISDEEPISKRAKIVPQEPPILSTSKIQSSPKIQTAPPVVKQENVDISLMQEPSETDSCDSWLNPKQPMIKIKTEPLDKDVPITVPSISNPLNTPMFKISSPVTIPKSVPSVSTLPTQLLKTKTINAVPMLNTTPIIPNFAQTAPTSIPIVPQTAPVIPTWLKKSVPNVSLTLSSNSPISSINSISPLLKTVPSIVPLSTSSPMPTVSAAAHQMHMNPHFVVSPMLANKSIDLIKKYGGMIAHRRDSMSGPIKFVDKQKIVVTAKNIELIKKALSKKKLVPIRPKINNVQQPTTVVPSLKLVSPQSLMAKRDEPPKVDVKTAQPCPLTINIIPVQQNASTKQVPASAGPSAKQIRNSNTATAGPFQKPMNPTTTTAARIPAIHPKIGNSVIISPITQFQNTIQTPDPSQPTKSNVAPSIGTNSNINPTFTIPANDSSDKSSNSHIIFKPAQRYVNDIDLDIDFKLTNLHDLHQTQLQLNIVTRLVNALRTQLRRQQDEHKDLRNQLSRQNDEHKHLREQNAFIVAKNLELSKKLAIQNSQHHQPQQKQPIFQSNSAVNHKTNSTPLPTATTLPTSTTIVIQNNVQQPKPIHNKRPQNTTNATKIITPKSSKITSTAPISMGYANVQKPTTTINQKPTTTINQKPTTTNSNHNLPQRNVPKSASKMNQQQQLYQAARPTYNNETIVIL